MQIGFWRKLFSHGWFQSGKVSKLSFATKKLGFDIGCQEYRRRKVKTSIQLPSTAMWLCVVIGGL